MRRALVSLALLAGPAVFAQVPGTPPPPVRDETVSQPQTPPKVGPISVLTKWTTTFYGFIEADFIHDSTESFSNETAGNGAIVRPGTYGATHRRLIIGVRNSRLGFRINAPEFHGVRASALVEADFLGNQPTLYTITTEAATFTNPTFRLRHGFMKIETDYVDFLIGQTWAVFGNQPYNQLAIVQLQGVAGEVYGRTPQLRLSKTIGGNPIAVEISLAAARAPQRDAQLPDGQGALRLIVNDWKGVRTSGATGTSVDPLFVGVSGTVRRFVLREFNAAQLKDVTDTGAGFTADVLIPVIRGTLQDRANALTLNGSFAYGSGISDQYTSLTGGVPFPATVPTGQAYTQNIDPGIISFTPDGMTHTIDWRTIVVGLQYYLPPDGKIWVSSNFSSTYSGNANLYGSATSVFNHAYFIDGNIFWEPITPVRLGLEYAYTHQTYADKMETSNHRFVFSSWFIW